MTAGAPGFFGKVSTHGDFVTRALPPELVQGWDDWLQQAMHASGQQLGGAWLALYLTSPVWRFALADGVLGEDGWAGVMMPSVDRVGRHFPLMIAAPLVKGTALTALMAEGTDWFDAIEDAARATLAADFALECLAPLLAALAPMKAGPGPVCEAGRAGWRFAAAARDPGMVTLAEALLHGHSLWWSEGGPNVTPSVLACKGMPDAQAFAAMLDGRWREHGWGTVRAPAAAQEAALAGPASSVRA